MNAYELAERAEGLAYEIPADWSSGEPKNVATEIATMLRQQAKRIEELEHCLIVEQEHNQMLQHKELSRDDIYALAKEFDIWLIPEDVNFIQFVLQRSKQ